MPLINCPECQKLISDQSYACPHCGYSLKAPLPSQEQEEPVKSPLQPKPIVQEPQKHRSLFSRVVRAVLD